MINLKRRQPLRKAHLSKQRGGALILIAFMIGIALTAFVIKNFNTSSIKAEQDAKTMEALGQAKEALIAWSVAHPSWPGVMPFPDRGTDSGGYDGESDCVTSGVTSTHLLGKLPSLNDNPCFTPQTEIGIEFRDGSGEWLWYAVSRNLVRTNGTATTPVINPSIIDNPVTAPWMTVRDSAGTILSNRVAAVIIAPGPALSGQDRSGNDAPPSNFLDQSTVSGTNYSNADYDEVFIIGDTTSAIFNDRLIYITIDELIDALEKRAANVVIDALLNYAQSPSLERPDARDIGYFPYVAPLGATRNYGCRSPTGSAPHNTIDESLGGLLPVSPSNSSCQYSQQLVSLFPFVLRTSVSCSLGFEQVESISFETSGISFVSSAGSCTHVGNVCTCTGSGSCSRFGDNFTCDAGANCQTDMDFSAVSGSTVNFNNGEFNSRSSNCQLANPCEQSFSRELECSGFGSGSGSLSCADPTLNTGSSELPAWFISNGWQNYFYYRNSRDGNLLTSGGRDELSAILIGVGKPIINPNAVASKVGNQVHPSCEVGDYLDSIENTNLDEVYDPYVHRRSLNYNDHVYIVE